MELILTHEQADFDAVAAQLAAHKLRPAATPVLPRRVNRNVRAYLSLYGEELPFVEPDDLPRVRVERVTLVDTQNLATLKGMGRKMAVYIVDHHPLARSLPEGWTAAIGEVGATTTVLVEELREADGGRLSPTEATLLLLGIYEDTGGLSYQSTSPRDVHAAAWLLEQGASLAVADDFLHHPLTDDQRALYERLLAATETHEINGQLVMLAGAPAEGLTEEFSTLAHKLRDLFEPAALFMLVETRPAAGPPSVQLVARSTSEAVDAGAVAAHFGGGGHNRAAAALIRRTTLAAARAELLRRLPEFVHPAASVEQIMSRGAQTIPAQMSAREAAERMTRYGYEGFPVVRDGNVVGLLTRRAVDRAMTHRMGEARVESIMEAGRVVVKPGDSVEHLQRLMTAHGWGQVPVVDPQGGQVVGIVTRTDVIKLLAGQPARRGRENVADRLEAALSDERLSLLKRVAGVAHEMNLPLYLVGGFVRDLLLGLPSQDFDLVVEGDAIALARRLAERFGGRVRSHPRFGTAKWLFSSFPVHPSSLDFVSARTEFYPHPSALPQVEQGSIKLDLHRRDFTINTLAIRLDGQHYGDLLDFWGGRRDLHDRVVRVLHSISFVDDPTRMLRAVRLEQRLGFRLEARTIELIRHALPLLDRVSGDRVRHELEFILREDEPEGMLVRLAELGILAHIHPALAADDWLRRKFAEARRVRQERAWRLKVAPALVFLYFALMVLRLERRDLNAVLRRLRVRKETADHLRQVSDLREQTGRLAESAPPSRIVAWLEAAHERALVAYWIGTEDPLVRERVAEFLARWRWLTPRTDGEALKLLGLQPGPQFGQILRRLRAAWLDGEVTDEAGERALRDSLISQVSAGLTA